MPNLGNSILNKTMSPDMQPQGNMGQALAPKPSPFDITDRSNSWLNVIVPDPMSQEPPVSAADPAVDPNAPISGPGLSDADKAAANQAAGYTRFKPKKP